MRNDIDTFTKARQPPIAEIRQLMTQHELQAVFLNHRDALLRFLRARGAGDNAEDILQDLWLRVSDMDEGNIASPLPYLYRAANNLMHDRYRMTQRSRQRDHDWSDVHRGTGDASDLPLPDRALIARQRLAEIEATIRSEGSRVLKVFRRFRVDGISQRQIAEELGISLSSVEKDLQRAYRALARWREGEDVE
ncbi:MAG: hypothetical protein Pars92KO_27230 [Parasphingorhabdus sp.]